MWYDFDTCHKGGKGAIKWIRNAAFSKYSSEYFPISLKKVTGVELDPKKNYLFCTFPHGVIATGVYHAFGSPHCKVHELFPDHSFHISAMTFFFRVPFWREYGFSLGGISCSARSLNYMLGRGGGGKVAVLVVGGAAEARYAIPDGDYNIVLKNRKGFVKIALKNGTPLVPVFSFGEIDIFNQLQIPEGSLLSKIQDYLKKLTRILFIIPVGRGFFQHSFGIIPHRRPITLVVGHPIDVEKVDNPTQEDIDNLHQAFQEKLQELFENEKHKYLKDPHKKKLIIR